MGGAGSGRNLGGTSSPAPFSPLLPYLPSVPHPLAPSVNTSYLSFSRSHFLPFPPAQPRYNVPTGRQGADATLTIRVQSCILRLRSRLTRLSPAGQERHRCAIQRSSPDPAGRNERSAGDDDGMVDADWRSVEREGCRVTVDTQGWHIHGVLPGC
ncbi:hypothetical protein K523DRAFT_83516 [Schizophyllum commune Tattone D]|nr:hypothetical protein K523DRAFT_83516 [Schizophyllum commune Tattone D]